MVYFIIGLVFGFVLCCFYFRIKTRVFKFQLVLPYTFFEDGVWHRDSVRGDIVARFFYTDNNKWEFEIDEKYPISYNKFSGSDVLEKKKWECNVYSLRVFSESVLQRLNSDKSEDYREIVNFFLKNNERVYVM